MASKPLLLEGSVEQVDTSHEIEELREQFAEYQQHVQSAMQRLQGQIDGIRQALRMAAGDTAPVNGSDPRLQSLDKWEAIKRRLGDKEAELIDVLLTSGPRTNTQLKPLLRLAYSTVCALTQRMANMGFITKQGDCYTLKEN